MDSASRNEGDGHGPRASPAFQTTLWSVVLQATDSGAPEAQAAWEQLYRAYWYPLYAYLRRRGMDVEGAQDSIQDLFFRILAKNQLASVTQEKGRFRSYLLSAANHLMANDWRRTQRLKRGGGRAHFTLDEAEAEQRYQADLADRHTPEKLFERRWALALLDQVLDQLKGEYQSSGRARLFEEIWEFLSGDALVGYATAATRLGMSEGAVRVAVHRLRGRYRDLLRACVAETVESPAEVEAELRELMAALRE